MYNGPVRKHQRLKDYDYSQDGIYFLTFCCYKKQCFLGEIVEGKMVLNEYGRLVEEEIVKTQEMREEVTIDSFVVMPNHVHILVMTQSRVRMHSHPTDKNESSGVFDERGALGLQGNNISSIIRGLKASITRRIRQEHNDYEFKWQRSFYDVIIKNDEQLQKTRLYIENNPLKWEIDSNNPKNEEKAKRLRKNSLE